MTDPPKDSCRRRERQLNLCERCRTKVNPNDPDVVRAFEQKSVASFRSTGHHRRSPTALPCLGTSGLSGVLDLLGG